jgi:hypothetical protein
MALGSSLSGIPESPFLKVFRCGNRVSASGRGTILHRSTRAVNLKFGRKVVTLQAGPGFLSPSSILVDLPRMPDVQEAFFDGDVLCTDAFRVRITGVENLRFNQKDGFDIRFAFTSLHPFIRPHDHSIVKAMLRSLYNLEIGSQGLEKDIVARQERILRCSRSLSELTKGLLGIGYGLTPSGDDFILGIIAALSLQGRDMSRLRTAIEEYENPFSRTILEDACEGCFSEPLLALMNCISSERDPRDAVGALLRVGSTSGHDTLAGIYYGLYKSMMDEGGGGGIHQGVRPPPRVDGV